MRFGASSQYGSTVVILEEGDNADEVIEAAEENEATYEADDHYLVVRFPGRPDEVYTEDALRRSFPITAAT